MTSKASIDGTSSREFWWPAREYTPRRRSTYAEPSDSRVLATRLDIAVHLLTMLIQALCTQKLHATSADAHRPLIQRTDTMDDSRRCRACAPLWMQLNGLPVASPSGAYMAGYLTPYFLRAWPTN